MPVRDTESIDILISAQGFTVMAPLVVLWIVIFGILGIVIDSFSTESVISGSIGTLFCFGKNQYCTASEMRKAMAKRLMMRSLSMMIS